MGDVECHKTPNWIPKKPFWSHYLSLDFNRIIDSYLGLSKIGLINNSNPNSCYHIYKKIAHKPQTFTGQSGRNTKWNEYRKSCITQREREMTDLTKWVFWDIEAWALNSVKLYWVLGNNLKTNWRAGIFTRIGLQVTSPFLPADFLEVF